MSCREQTLSVATGYSGVGGQAGLTTKLPPGKSPDGCRCRVSLYPVQNGRIYHRRILDHPVGSLSSESKSLLTDKIKITVNQTLAGATIVFDRWGKDEQTGQFINYIVLELKGDDYLKNLYKELEKNDAITVDRDLLQRLFLKHIDENSKK